MAKKDKNAKGGKAGRIEALEARLARIEAALPTTSAPSQGGSSQNGSSPEDADWRPAAPQLAALGHPVRLAILRATLDGAQTTQALATAIGGAAEARPVSSGQLYHHLRELTAAGWLAPAGRGAYGVPEDRRAALLAVLGAVLAV